ncbi:MAG: hypothetical protein U5K72_08270 [Balneolaceae bacterium]|nr:hypothetical protein [Balneolaceae bacterium]
MNAKMFSNGQAARCTYAGQLVRHSAVVWENGKVRFVAIDVSYYQKEWDANKCISNGQAARCTVRRTACPAPRRVVIDRNGSYGSIP